MTAATTFNPATHASAHVRWSELRCADAMQTEYPADYRDDRLPILLREFEHVRLAFAARVGRELPLIIQSGYRTEVWNRHEDGAKHSQHVQGRALDIRPADVSLVPDLYAAALQVAKSWGVIRGLGRYASWVHLDTRPTTVLKLWDLRSGL